MSFGWSTGDVVAAAQLCWRLYKALDDVNGAPEHQRQSAELLRLIQFRLTLLSKVIGNSDDPEPSTEEATLLDSAELSDMRKTIVNLKAEVQKLEEQVNKGSNIQHDPSNQKRCRDEFMRHIRKLEWYFGRVKEVDALIEYIHRLTVPLPELYQRINLEFAKRQATKQAVYQETLIRWFKLLDQKVTFLCNAIMQQNIMHINGQGLQSGPDAGIPTTAPVLNTTTAVSHLEGIAHEIMSARTENKVKNICGDFQLRRILGEWFSGQNPPRLWLYGDQASTVSAAVYAAALDRRQPCIAFTGRHFAGTQQLNHQSRLFRMVYSLLFQILQQFDEDAILIVTDVDGSFTDLDLSMESMPLAISFLRYFLGLLPQCICIIDGWQFIGNSAENEVG
ncbi:hypothetical protein CEP51_003378 [Fusarium floridanum]|uniref:Uncharacterized protein n=1 Tax=Fusarium floridanum TaxID=1325733 RepID=A0A428S6H6_9HYPO|nr:hypothetical protein CEP51_003378 [Fusarium floridanum]